jgi:uncharacterized protein
VTVAFKVIIMSLNLIMPTIESASAWYPQNDPVHGFDHIMRVYRLAERLAIAEGADVEIVRAAALLHDAHGGDTTGGEGGRSDHHQVSADFARQVLGGEGWPEDRIAAVEHCIRAHRFRDQAERPQTLEAQILFDADKLDAIGAIGVLRVIAYAVLDAQPLYAEPSEQFLNTGVRESGEPHTPYHEFIFKLCKLRDQILTPTARRLADGRHEYLETFFDQLNAEIKGER